MKKVIRMIISGILAVAAATSLGAQSRKTEIWDFGGAVEEKGAVNHITVDDLNKMAELGSDGKYVGGTMVFGDATVVFEKNDRAYYSGSKNYGNQGYSSMSFDDGYVSEGMWYCNGKGGEGKRYVLIKNVKAGDLITMYGRTSNAAEEKIHFASVGDDGSKNGLQDEVAPYNTEERMYNWIAAADGAYKIYAEATAGKPVFYRVKRTPAVEVSGNLNGAAAGAELKFVVKDTNQEIPAKISGKSYSATLPAGYSLTAVLMGMSGYGIASESKIVSFKADQSGTAAKLNLNVAESKTYKVSGTVKGFAEGYDVSKLAVLFTPPANSVYQPVEAKVDEENFTFAGNLEPSVKYTAVLSGANDYDITSDAVFDSLENVERDVEVKAKPVYEVSGEFFGNVSEYPTAISFKNMDDGYVYEAKVIAHTYSVKLRDGKYEALSENDIATTINHVVVEGKEVKKDIKYSRKAALPVIHPVRSDIKVGKKEEFKTVNAALKAAYFMNPKSEKERVTIHIEPGVYREQIIVEAPYITLKNDNPAKEVKLTWYYGIGYYYYSADTSGFYNEDLAYDKFSKKIASKWGCATFVKNTAKAFRAEGITFETSFNKYVTDEEIADGVQMDGSFNFARKISSDVRSKAATERSTAIAIEGTEAEFNNCRFLGSQDTLYTATISAYFRNCFIEGNTDFIFGDGDVVFENCEIHFAGYTDRSASGYATAARTSTANGYLFYNCILSQESGVYNAASYLGRPWGPNARVAWVNTVLGSNDILADDGWTEMSGNKPEKANFREYNTLWNNEPEPLDKMRLDGTVIAEKDAEKYTPSKYFGNWKPAFHKRTTETKVAAKKASFTTDDDINTPYPGHTITVHYTLGKGDADDASLIQWYRCEPVKKGKETLVKQSTGFGDKTYLIGREDSGYIIKCVVTPKLRNGISGKSVEAKLDKKINEGYALPAKASVNRPRTADATNIFLASDSTCKDYSAAGMWNGGQTRNEGAWGEFLQNWFNAGIAVQNYANGGRSCRNFMNEGSLAKIAENIGKGDYLFIQFGHNDCSNASGYLEDRYVPLGTPDAKGIYPVTEGKKVPTPASYASKYGDEFYSWDCGATYKWYLKQYIEVARKAGATPVLVTPVSRLYFANGKIRPHHDSTDTSTGTQTTTNNAYVEAVRQLAKEEKVLLIDGFEITKNLYERAYADKNGESEARELMFKGDSTHNNKLGGFIIAGEFAKEIKAKIPALGKSIVHPTKAIGENSDGSIMFSVDGNGKFSCNDAYWTAYAQKLMDGIR
ncbi:MAG: hypothetical protein KBT11_09395 [Treponema sp.]|nr:hypothetical protein [Candidatus Treponema equifaecale]